MPTRSCPTCRKSVPSVVGSGRPRIFCTPACRREMIRLRIEVGNLEESLAIARGHAQTGFWPGKRFWGEMVELHTRELAETRRRVSPE